MGRATDDEALKVYRKAITELIEQSESRELFVSMADPTLLPAGEILHRIEEGGIRFRFVPAAAAIAPDSTTGRKP